LLKYLLTFVRSLGRRNHECRCEIALLLPGLPHGGILTSARLFLSRGASVLLHQIRSASPVEINATRSRHRPECLLPEGRTARLLASLKWPKKSNPRASQGSSLALPRSAGEASGQRKAATADEAQSVKST